MLQWRTNVKPPHPWAGTGGLSKWCCLIDWASYVHHYKGCLRRRQVPALTMEGVA